MKSLLSAHHPFDLMAVHMKHPGCRVTTLARVAGAGYKALACFSSSRSKSNERIMAIYTTSSFRSLDWEGEGDPDRSNRRLFIHMEAGTPFTKKFNSAADTLFETHWITKQPITIQLFPQCKVSTKLIGTELPGKDLLIGFDIYSQLKHFQILPHGLKFKQQFRPYCDVPRLYLQQEADPMDQFKEMIIIQSCANSHQEFLQKCSTPLWQNEEFFIKLPFKKNEDCNPTKASHSGMNPDQQSMAIAECQDLLAADLIEVSNSQWACEAFYVNKRSEQVRGKMRLVINYQPLNHFLQDEKFPIPTVQ